MEGMRTRADVQEFRTPATPTSSSIARPLAMAEGEAVAERANTSSELSQITSLRSLRKVDVVEMADLTSISTWTYLWTCAIGLIPSNLPYAYGAQLGASLASEFPPSDPVMLTMTILGFVASVAIAWKVRMQPSPHSPRAPPC